jgi:hypothetical protein
VAAPDDRHIAVVSNVDSEGAAIYRLDFGPSNIQQFALEVGEEAGAKPGMLLDVFPGRVNPLNNRLLGAASDQKLGSLKVIAVRPNRCLVEVVAKAVNAFPSNSVAKWAMGQDEESTQSTVSTDAFYPLSQPLNKRQVADW